MASGAREEAYHWLTAGADLPTVVSLDSKVRDGIFTYTTVYAGLDAAARFAELFGEEELASRYRQAAEEIKAATLDYLWDEERGHFLRMITVDKNGTIQKDPTLDSSVCALFQFGVLSAHDPRVKRTMQALEETLWVKTSIGGMR